MANTINLATDYLRAFEQKLHLGELTKDLNKGVYDWDGSSHSVKIAIPEIKGLASYNKEAGYNKGTFNLTWDTKTMSQDRYVKIGVDAIDNKEAKEQALASAISESAIIATEEMDMYRLCTIANCAGAVTNTASLTTGALVASAIEVGEASQINARGRLADCVLYINATNYMKLKNAQPYRFDKGQDPSNLFGTFDTMKVVVCPDDMLAVGCQYNATTGNIEAKTATVNGDTTYTPVNFMIVNTNAVACPVGLYETKYIDHSVNQTSRDDEIIPNWYHDCFVFERYEKAIYVSKGQDITLS